MDPVAQLHEAQQQVFGELDLGSWSAVGEAVWRLIDLEQRHVFPAARRCGLGANELDPGLSRHALWIALLRCEDHPAWRERMRSALIDHVAWSGAEVLAQVCRHLDRDAYDELGSEMHASSRPAASSDGAVGCGAAPRPTERPAAA
jgi:hypothetical protein